MWSSIADGVGHCGQGRRGAPSAQHAGGRSIGFFGREAILSATAATHWAGSIGSQTKEPYSARFEEVLDA